jgi:hypothetical protein
MGVIETEEAAKRLARVIVSDIEIYNREKFQAGADLTAAIEEGRALFRSRVAPELHPLFTSVLEDRRASRKKAESAQRAADTASAERNGAAAAVSADRNGVAPPPAKRGAEAVEAAPAAKPAVPRTTNRTAVAAPVAPRTSTPVPTPAVAAHAAPAEVPAVVPAAATPAPAAAAPAPARPTHSPSVRGGIIDTEEAAARLARVILSDIELYGAKKIAAGVDLTYEIEEGRSLFKSRVSGELLGIFENALATKSFGPRRRTASPVPMPKAKPPVVEAEPTPPAAPVARTRTPVPVAPARPQVSAAKAPPALQPRPGLSRPATAPHAIPAAVVESGSARHLSAAAAAAAAFGAVTPAPTPTSAIERSGRHLAPPPGRPAAASYTPDLVDRAADQPTPMPGGYDGATTPEPTPAPVGVTPAPVPARTSSLRMAATPPPVPARASAAMRTIGAPPPTPPRRERVPSSPEFPVHVDSAPIQVDDVHAEMPSQEVLDALPATAPLPPPAAAPRMSLTTVPRVATPPSLPMTGAPTALEAPAPSQLSEQAGDQLGEVASEGEGEVVSLRRRMSTPRLMLTIFTLGGAAAAIWYFLLR